MLQRTLIATALVACAGQSDPGVASVDVGPSVSPRVAKLSYTTFGRELHEPVVRALPESAIVIDVGREDQRARMAVKRDGNLVMSLDDNGRLHTGGQFPGPLADLVESLPAPSSRIEVGVAYESGTPDDAYLARAFDEGKGVIWQVTRNTPIGIYTDGDRKLVALDVAGYNRAYTRDAAGAIETNEIGMAFRARTDLLYTPETGWVMLRLRRIVQAELRGNPEATTFAELVEAPHSEFNACLDVGLDVAGLAAATRNDFPSCL